MKYFFSQLLGSNIKSTKIILKIFFSEYIVLKCLKKTGTTGTPKKTASPCCVYDFTLFDEITQAEVRKTLSILCKKYCFQLEKGEQTEKLHFQGRMSLKNKKE